MIEKFKSIFISFQGVPKETAKIMLSFDEGKFFDAFQGEISEDFIEMSKPFFQLIAEDIVKQKKRLGGTFAVALAVPVRKIREILRKFVGPDLVFVVMNLSEACQAERMKQRHGEGAAAEALTKMNAGFKPAEEDEEGAYNMLVDEGMSEKDVMQKVVELIDKF